LKRVFFLGTAPTLMSNDLNYIKKNLEEFLSSTSITADGYGYSFS
jgi:hypothetical protein